MSAASIEDAPLSPLLTHEEIETVLDATFSLEEEFQLVEARMRATGLLDAYDNWRPDASPH